MLWFTHILTAVVFFIIGILFAVRNRAIAGWISRRYIDAGNKIKGHLPDAERFFKDTSGSIPIGPPVSIGEVKKYLLRFGPSLAALVALMAILKPQDFPVVLYKICLVLVAVILAEIIWAVNYKAVFGKTEGARDEYTQRSVLIFRAILYLGIILGVTWGL